MSSPVPVPFITRYDTEHPGTGPVGAALAINPATGAQMQVLTTDEDAPDALFRDELGWLWTPSPNDRSGKPEWSQVHPGRQRQAMDHLLCQVCGRLTSHDAFWIVESEWVEDAKRRRALAALAGRTGPAQIITPHPPVCRSCHPIAMRHCPALRRGHWLTLTAERAVAVGVLADVYGVVNGKLEQVRRNVQVRPTDPDCGMALARQRLVALRDWRE